MNNRYSWRGSRTSEISKLNKNAEEDEKNLTSLGFHRTNILYFLKGSYEERAQFIAGSRRMVGLQTVLILSFFGGAITSLMYAINGWIYGYIFLGVGLFLCILVILTGVVSKKNKREDPQLKKIKECMNYVILETSEFFLGEILEGKFDAEFRKEFIFFHSKGIEKDYDEIQKVLSKYSLDDPVEEIMSEYVRELKNPIIDTEEELNEYIDSETSPL
jgi:hypothetical protein